MATHETADLYAAEHSHIVKPRAVYNIKTILSSKREIPVLSSEDEANVRSSIEAKKRSSLGLLLCHAVAGNDANRVSGLIRQGADPNRLDEHGNTSLHIAAALGLSSLVAPLMHAGGNIETVSTSTGDTPLMAAVISGRSDMALTLLSLSARPETTNKLNSTPLQIATCDNDTHLMLQLISCGAIIDAVSMPTGWTALHMAAGLKLAMAAAVLIKYGAKTNTIDSDGDTPLITACSMGFIDCVQQLLAGGADTNITTKVSNFQSNLPPCLDVSLFIQN